MRRHAATGIVLWVVMGLGVAMVILAVAFHTMVQDQNRKAHLVRHGLAAQSVAESGVNGAVDALRHALADPASPTSRAFLDAGPEGVDPLPLPAGWMDAVRGVLPEGAGVDLSVTLRLEDVRPTGDPADASQGFDPGEKTATLVIASTGSVRTSVQTVEERRKLRIVNLTLPVVSRFTLFVGSPDATDEVSDGYNRYANDIAGSPDPTVPPGENFLPIVCRNHEEGLETAGDLDSHGAIYLGGDRDVVLNLTSGGEYRFGQYFHFYNFLTLDTSRPAAFLNDAPPAFFTQPHEYAGLTQQFVIKHAVYGYFTLDRHPTDPQDMDRDGILRLYLDGRPNLRSSTLHLFGSSLEPSPTRVYGRVYHSYPIYSAVTVDVDGDGLRDGVVKMLPAVFDDEFDGLDLSDPIPTEIPNVAGTGTIELDPATATYGAMFGDAETYGRFASLLVEREAYNSGVDYLKSRGEFPPREPALDPAVDYPNPGTDVRIPSWEPGVDHFRGDLSGLDGLRAFARKPVATVQNQEELLRLFLHPGGRLRLGAVVRIREGGLDLPERVFVEEGGAVLCPGLIKLDSVEAGEGQVLTLCSLEGDIEGRFGSPCEVSLVALRGAVRNAVPGHPFELTGNLATGRLAADAFPRGGKIVYEKSLNPTLADSKRHYRVYVADRASQWDL